MSVRSLQGRRTTVRHSAAYVPQWRNKQNVNEKTE